jgi:2'-5' RNA ligase
MVALLPINSEWCRIDLPHLTLVYAGEKASFGPNAFNDLAKDAASIAMMSSVLTLRVLGRDLFGEEDDVEVLRLFPTPELMAMRHVVESWNASEFPFNPHVTVGPKIDTAVVEPKYIAFDRIMVAFGEDNLTFRLKNS